MKIIVKDTVILEKYTQLKLHTEIRAAPQFYRLERFWSYLPEMLLKLVTCPKAELNFTCYCHIEAIFQIQIK